ncbi:2-hydroxychromene-2-carboxylate isomerase [Rhodobium orientis]|uniref:2-hydroxychromene-2-carboxylate isomerase n=1 Tax=Rhodobium orientis TaxID=34017 RepID=A0A327JSQ5_9HYPH|nr:2-hydroxychromene-2-carboxylate isomerase [Rhodobium orientis]MBB4303705.1 2-hydroxychromene-2-carboxylate isomerase [Rhodobium orientis]MBK5951840.1 disulfide bond formation protein DsbA [Rhodobium orientis]RAI28494.1 disulfide bond formation protein DsbA [Rhodobium orientis]
MARPTVDFWYEFASTYSYPAAFRVEEVAERFGVAVRWRVFALGPVFKAEGLPADSPFNWQAAKGRYMWRDVARLCADLDLAFAPPVPFPQPSLLAARVALLGEDGGWGIDFAKAVFAAEFGDGEQIGERAVIAGILERLGLDAGPILDAATGAGNKARLRAVTEEARALGIFGAPDFVTADGELFWGNDRMEAAFRWALDHAENAPRGAPGD